MAKSHQPHNLRKSHQSCLSTTQVEVDLGSIFCYFAYLDFFGGILILKVSFLGVVVECQIFWGTAKTWRQQLENLTSVSRWPLRCFWTLCSCACRWQNWHQEKLQTRMDRKVETTVLSVFLPRLQFPNLHLPWPRDCVGRAARLTSWKRVSVNFVLKRLLKTVTQ